MAGRVVSSGSDAGRSPRTLAGHAGRKASSVDSVDSVDSSVSPDAQSSPSAVRSPRPVGTDARRGSGAFARVSARVKRATGMTARKPRAARTVSSHADSHDPHESHESSARSKPGEFVDARRLVSEDLVTRTLRENAGGLGVSARPKVVDFAARARERKRVGIRVLALRAALAALAIAAVSALVWLLFFSPVLRLESSQITVEGGNEWVSEDEVRAIAVRQAGRSLLLVNTSRMTSGLSEIPGVTSAKATKRYPHGLTLTIRAQRPAAMLKASEDELTAVDAKGRVLNAVNGASVSGIPVIEVRDVNAGLKSRAVREALKILDVLPESMRNEITKVSAETQDSITTELNGGEHVVVWGDSSNMKLKKADVDKILSDPNVIGDKRQVDVSAPYRPVLR